jgi:hypothetical protein
MNNDELMKAIFGPQENADYDLELEVNGVIIRTDVDKLVPVLTALISMGQ